MKNSFIIVIIGLLCLGSRNRDFETFWQLYIDDRLVQQCGYYPNPNGCLVELKKMDVILYSKTATVKYFRDTPCDECPISVQIKNMQDSLLFGATSYGTSTPISFPLRLFGKQNKYNSFKVYFIEKNEPTLNYESQIFQIDIK